MNISTKFNVDQNVVWMDLAPMKIRYSVVQSIKILCTGTRSPHIIYNVRAIDNDERVFSIEEHRLFASKEECLNHYIN